MALFSLKNSSYERISQSSKEIKKRVDLPPINILIALVVVAYTLLSIQNYIHL
jgi:hypothetical protein